MGSHDIFTVEELMGKLSKIVTSIAVSAVFLSASPANAQGTPAYITTVYNDSSRTAVIGHIWWEGCSLWDDPQYVLDGSDNGYHEAYYAGYCLDGEMRLF